MDKLTIIRERWLRGYGEDGISWLVSPDTCRMCCLGFLGKKCGFAEAEMKGVTSPSQLGIRQENWPAGLIEEYENTKLASELMHVNDRYDSLEEDREARLIKLFAELNIELEFISEVQDG